MDRNGTYLDGARASGREAPVVVQVEADKAEDGEVEEHLPARVQSPVAVEPRAPVHEGRLDAVHGRGREVFRNGSEAVSLAELVGREQEDVEHPRRHGHVSPGKRRRDLVVDVEDRQDLDCRDTVEDDQEKEGEEVVERRALLEAGVALLGDGLLGDLGGDGVDGIPRLSEEWVRNQEGAHVGQVGPEEAILLIRDVLRGEEQHG